MKENYDVSLVVFYFFTYFNNIWEKQNLKCDTCLVFMVTKLLVTFLVN